MNYYQIRIYDADRNFILLSDNYSSLSLVKQTNNIGALEIVWPTLPTAITKDYIFIVEVSYNQSQLQILGDTCFLVSKITYDNNGVTVTANDPLCLLERRLVAYYSGSEFTKRTGLADNLIKDLIRENTGFSDFSGQKVDRTIPFLEIEKNLSLAPEVTIDVPWIPLIEAIQNIAEIALNSNVKVYYDIIVNYQLNMFFRTFIGTRGIDRSEVILNENHLNDVVLDIDFNGLRNAIYIGGSGKLTDRTIITVNNDESIKNFGRYEFFEKSQKGDITLLKNEGLSAMIKDFKIKFRGNFVNQIGMQFGVHFKFGDLVTVQSYGHEFKCIVNEINLTINDSKEDLSLTFSND